MGPRPRGLPASRILACSTHISAGGYRLWPGCDALEIIHMEKSLASVKANRMKRPVIGAPWLRE